MRANSIVAVLAVLGGCSPPEPPPAVVAPLNPAPSPAPGPSQATLDELLRETQPVRGDTPSQSTINSIRESARTGGSQQAAQEPSAGLPPPVLDRLMFQCADEQTFAIRIRGERLEVFPPGHTVGYLVLTEVPSDSGVRYTAADADFRLEHDLATLRFANEIYLDCVSSPAAAVWQAPPRRDVLPRDER